MSVLAERVPIVDCAFPLEAPIAAPAVWLGESEHADDSPIGHTWVELTLDGERWFPVDPTRTPMQFGWGDADLVKTMRTIDCAQPSLLVTYDTQRGRGVRPIVVARPVVECVERSGTRRCAFDVSIERVDFGHQRVALTVSVSNPQRHAAVTHVAASSLAQTRSIGEAAGHEDRGVWCVLGPRDWQRMVLVVDFTSLDSETRAAL